MKRYRTRCNVISFANISIQTRDALKTFQRNLVSAKAHQKGWSFGPNEDHIQAQFKALLFGSAGLSGDVEIIKAAQDMFAAFASGDRKAIHPNIRGSVYAIALVNGGEKEFEVLLKEYRTTTDADERNTALRSLGRVKGKVLQERASKLALSDDVKNQDIYLPLIGLRSEAEGVEALWQWLTGNWEELKIRCPPGLTMLGTLVKLCSAEFGTQEQLEKVQKFFADKDKAGFKMALEQSLDSIRARIGWVGRDSEDVEKFLEGEGLKEKL